MRSIFLEETTLDSMWFSLLRELYYHGSITPIDTGSFAGSKRLEFDFVAGTIYYPVTRPLAPIMPEGVASVATDEDIEKYFVNYLMDSSLNENEHYKYATWIVGGKYKLPKAFDGFSEIDGLDINVPNQLQWCINHFKNKGFGNNHCYITVGYPESSFAYDLPYNNETERNTSPCLRGIDFKIINNVLHCAVTMRSWDLYLGWPTNMGGFTILMEYVASELGIDVGTLSFSSLKLHCYDFQIESVKQRLRI